MLLLYKNLASAGLTGWVYSAEMCACLVAYFPYILCRLWVETMENCRYLTVWACRNGVFQLSSKLMEVLRRAQHHRRLRIAGFYAGLTRLGAWVGVACSLFRSSLRAAPDSVGRSLKPRPRTPPRLSPAAAASAQCRESLRPPGTALAQTLQLRAGSCSSSSSWHRERT